MAIPYYSEAVLDVSSCSTLAFKEGKAFGTCLKFQESLAGKHYSSRQAMRMWCDRTRKN